MGKVISFINMKGGVGKTTLAVNVGYTLSKEFNKKVILIDMDPQMNATQYTLKEDQIEAILKEPKKSIYGILSEEYNLPSVTRTNDASNEINPIFEISENFDLIPSHLKIMAINLDESPYRLRQYIHENLRDIYDIVIVDSPPTISSYTKVSLLASDMYVVPMKTDFLSFFGLPLLENYIERIKREFGQDDIEFLGIILTMVRPDWKIYKTVKEKLMQQPRWNSKLFSAELKYRTIVARALSPEERESRSQYILDLGDNDLKKRIVQIVGEILRRGRL